MIGKFYKMHPITIQPVLTGLEIGWTINEHGHILRGGGHLIWIFHWETNVMLRHLSNSNVNVIFKIINSNAGRVIVS